MDRPIRPDIAPRHGRQVCWRFITDNVAGIDGWMALPGKGSTLLAIPVSATHAYVHADLTLAADADPESYRHASLPELFAAFAALTRSLRGAPNAPFQFPSDITCRTASDFIKFRHTI